VKACDLCREKKVACPGRPGTVKVPRGKKRQRPAGSLSLKGKGKKRQKSPTLEAPEHVEYDDQAWVAAANSIVAELARTNSLLERSIQAAEGSRAAADRMCSGLEVFLKQQREFQALLFGELRMGLWTTPDEPQMMSDEGRMDSDEEEDEDDEVEEEEKGEEGSKESGSDMDESGEANDSMEM
jgi:hypothetical protein